MRLPVQTATVCACGKKCGWDGRRIEHCTRKKEIVINKYGTFVRYLNEKGEEIDETDINPS